MGQGCIELRNCLCILPKNLSKRIRGTFRYIAAECRPFWPLSSSSIGQSHACPSVMPACSDHPTRSLLPYASLRRHKLNSGPIALCTKSCDLHILLLRELVGGSRATPQMMSDYARVDFETWDCGRGTGEPCEQAMGKSRYKLESCYLGGMCLHSTDLYNIFCSL